MNKRILKGHFITETFVVIHNDLQRRVRLHKTDRFSHDTAFSNRHFYTPKVISEEILVFFMLNWCLYYPSSLPQHNYDILRFTAKIEIKI